MLFSRNDYCLAWGKLNARLWFCSDFRFFAHGCYVTTFTSWIKSSDVWTSESFLLAIFECFFFRTFNLDGSRQKSAKRIKTNSPPEKSSWRGHLVRARSSQHKHPPLESAKERAHALKSQTPHFGRRTHWPPPGQVSERDTPSTAQPHTRECDERERHQGSSERSLKKARHNVQRLRTRQLSSRTATPKRGWRPLNCPGLSRPKG